MRINRHTAALALTAVLVAGGAAYGLHTVSDHRISGASPADNEVTDTASEFLSAWQAGDLDKAARLTTDPNQAVTELRAYRDQTGAASLTLAPEPATQATVPFRVAARLNYLGTKATWNYTAKLFVVDDPAAGGPRVSWHSSVIHPSLPDGGGYTLQAFTQSGAPITTDRHGTPLTAHTQPGLTQILSQLQDRYAGQGQQALGIRLSAAGDGGGGRVVATLGRGTKAQIRTGLDATTQKVVDTAAARYPGASVVVIRPSTGDVLAAHTTGVDFDPTLEGVQAPGQIFELVTAAALLEQGAITPSTPVGCPAQASYGGRTFTDPGGFTAQNALFSEVFAHACDTGYIRLADELTGQDLASEARDVFGLGRDWHTGITTADGAVPELHGSDLAAAAVGQGEVRLNTLNLASLTATIQNGSFKQPLFTDPDTIGKGIAHAARPLSDHVADELRSLMRAYGDTAGIGAAAFGGVADQFTDSDQPITGWFTAYRGDLAVAVTAPEPTHQPKTAEDVVRAVLGAIG
ncbi:penicillin-binding transpeptidase domain-containing protein (plasmid) [Streptomyces canus]|uniref:penicillin-binding transpeptidase domain-containing protein n=1 Tax=Streptomyces canus TaxID=58343 RepID=UPI002F908048|nr:penicillin-binding transpeptidase domain-containing protein [Streptomyces canus]